MNKKKLLEMKKRVIALSMAGVIMGMTGCSLEDKKTNTIPVPKPISSEYSKPDKYYKYVIKDGEAVKVYNSKNTYLLFNKKTYEVSEFLYNEEYILFGLGAITELYDLPSEELVVYCDGIDSSYNENYYKYILNNNYQICLSDVADYVEGHSPKDFYSLDEIREIENQMLSSVKIISSAMKR